MTNQRTTTLILIILIVLALIGIAYYQSKNPRAGEPVACTLEAKICPDGSSVGRVGPSCEFASCPGPSLY